MTVVVVRVLFAVFLVVFLVFPGVLVVLQAFPGVSLVLMVVAMSAVPRSHFLESQRRRVSFQRGREGRWST